MQFLAEYPRDHHRVDNHEHGKICAAVKTGSAEKPTLNLHAPDWRRRARNRSTA